MSVMFVILRLNLNFFFFFFNDTATTEIYTLSLHDALPICVPALPHHPLRESAERGRHHPRHRRRPRAAVQARSEEHTSELQSPCNLVCRLLLEKKKKTQEDNGRLTIFIPHHIHSSYHLYHH